MTGITKHHSDMTKLQTAKKTQIHNTSLMTGFLDRHDNAEKLKSIT